MTLPCIKQWFTLAVPNPTDKNRTVQLGCHYEEVAEMALRFSLNKATASTIYNEATRLKECAQTIPDGFWSLRADPSLTDEDRKEIRIELLDALCDQIVTAVGVAHMFGLDIEGALAEVNRSNWSKFVDGKPTFDANGKIAKPATYSKPDLTPFL
jgi:hypothetical protein